MQCEFARQFFDMLSAIMAEQKVPREFSDGKLIYRAEAELLEKIEQYPRANVSKLSKILNVTKSAVTQISIKLLDKGLIETYKDPKNKKEKYFCLTDAGLKARKESDNLNSIAASRLCQYLRGLTDDEKNAILEFMRIMGKYLPMCAFNCQCDIGGKLCSACAIKKGV